MKTDNQISEPSIEAPSERGDGLGGSTVRVGGCPHNYSISVDYKMLHELAQTQPIVCFVDYGTNPTPRDVAVSRCSHGVTQISARGICYIWADTASDFILQCRNNHVEFVLPNVSNERPLPAKEDA